MKIPAQQLKAVLRKVQPVLPGTLIFAGSKVYAHGQNITMIAGLPVDLGTFAVSTEKFAQIVSKLDGDIDIEVME